MTTYSKIMTSNEKLYMKCDESSVFGILKIGEKNLFYRDLRGGITEMKLLCVLDFYVHESCQRNGVGKWLFERMLRVEQVDPAKLAYDRPSAKLLGFLRKHYNLSKYIPQNNNFVIYDDFFTVTHENHVIAH